MMGGRQGMDGGRRGVDEAAGMAGRRGEMGRDSEGDTRRQGGSPFIDGDRLRWRRARWGGLVLLAVVGMARAAGAAGLRVNPSASVPVGVYWVHEGVARRGQYVAVCPPPSRWAVEARRRGYLLRGDRCSGGFAEMLKVVAAVQGDVVQISAEGVHVNGELWPSSAQVNRDSRGRSLHAVELSERRLGPGEVLVMSEEAPDGFDGRYLGVLHEGLVQGVAERVW